MFRACQAAPVPALELVTAVISTVLIGGETTTPMETAGDLLILIAAVVEERRESTPEFTSATP